MRYLLLLAPFILLTRVFAQKINTELVPHTNFTKYELKNKKDTITFYLTQSNSTERLPLVVYINGSGWSSVFKMDNGRIFTTAGQSSWAIEAENKCRVMVIEKPGTAFLQQEQSVKFTSTYSLQSRSESIIKAIEYILKNEKIDKSKILLVGHSEGGIVAASIANSLKNRISNVAIIAGEGPSQLYSLYKFVEEESMTVLYHQDSIPSNKEQIEGLVRIWKDIQANPTSTKDFFMGLTYLRWSTMLSTSVIDELSSYNGKILIVQGTMDNAVHMESAKIAYISLLTKGKDVELKLMDEADHSFNLLNQPNIDGWQIMIQMTYQWFLSE